MDRTLILVKPDAFARNLTGEIIARFERKGLRIAALKYMTMDVGLAEQHYAEHEGKPFFPSLLEFITSGPVVAAIVEGPRAVAAFRQLAGATDPVEKAAPGTIRGDLALITPDNLVHGSDSPESAVREIELWFPAAQGGK
jgi:nucleoside-diphosphate kinase